MEVTSRGVAFLSFNTRGAGHVQEFIKGKGEKKEYVNIGGSLERFEDCLLDLGAAIGFLEQRGYNSFVLEGHSTGCQKVVHYKHVKKDGRVKGLVLLEPTDDPTVSARFLGKRYQEAMEYARRLVREGKPDDPMADWVPFGVQLSAQKFLSMSDSQSEEGRLFSYSGDLKEIRQIGCPVLAIHGAKTEYQAEPSEKLNILEKIIPDCKTRLFQSNHWFFEHEKELGETIGKWIVEKVFNYL